MLIGNESSRLAINASTPALHACAACTSSAAYFGGTRRRGFLSSLMGASIMAGAVVPNIAKAQSTPSASAQGKLIDVHHHVFAPEYLKELESAHLAQAPARKWSLAKSIDDMDKAGVTYALTSPTTPAASFGDSATRKRVARMCNEYAAKLHSDYPNRFGFFATLPMLDVQASLEEIAYSVDVLGANGVALLTSYDGRWLGDASFDPIWQEINRRKLVVYTHPANPACCSDLQEGIPGSVIEYATDTTRTITSLLFGGAAQKYQDMRIIFSHAGGTMPFLIERLTMLPVIKPDLGKKISPKQVLELIKSFYYDTAQASHPGALLSLLNLVDVSHVLFGTDFPYRTSLDHVQGLAKFGFKAGDLELIRFQNTEKLLKL